MPSFLLVFNRRTGERPVFEAFDRPGDAVRARFEMERRYRGTPEIEVVVLTAKSEEEIRATHSRYFESLTEQVDSSRAELAA